MKDLKTLLIQAWENCVQDNREVLELLSGAVWNLNDAEKRGPQVDDDKARSLTDPKSCEDSLWYRYLLKEEEKKAIAEQLQRNLSLANAAVRLVAAKELLSNPLDWESLKEITGQALKSHLFEESNDELCLVLVYFLRDELAHLEKAERANKNRWKWRTNYAREYSIEAYQKACLVICRDLLNKVKSCQR